MAESEPTEPVFNPDAGVEVNAIFGLREGRGLVVLKQYDGAGHTLVSMHTAPKAREIAVMLIEAAGAADGDEAVMLTLGELGMELPQVAAFINDLRAKRILIDERARHEARLAVANDQSSPDFDPDDLLPGDLPPDGGPS